MARTSSRRRKRFGEGGVRGIKRGRGGAAVPFCIGCIFMYY